ncbi:MAG: nitroreductase [Nitrospirae bacterium GWD2_57_9]|nr:MAG: nitroreductase [Nitrospirae bacterium GWD2_57_9]OGW47414.1 MAG: nitroreductase [Nitrospirae bacterium GWC2_57_9]
MTNIPDMALYRKPDHDIFPLFVNRWSPRAMSGQEISKEELMRLFEAARWAPSSMNNQPWRFLFAMRNTGHWEKFFGILSENNKSWCRNAAVLIVVVSKKTFDFNGKPARTHSYDTGASWLALALQGSFMGLVVHGMQGFDYDRAKLELNVSDEYQVEAMAAVGRPGNKYDLPFALEQREFPSNRKRLKEIVFEGGFKNQL